MKKITILGSTGSIGTQTLEVVKSNRQDFEVIALAARTDIVNLESQIREFEPMIVCVWDNDKAMQLKELVKDCSVKIVSGMEGLIECVSYEEADTVVAAMVGMIGIQPVITAIEMGKDIALANKETLVTAGHIIIPLAKKHGVSILPVDSEHSAVYQSLNGERKSSISKVILTASGGPFRGKKMADLEYISVEDALNHPNWSMGNKVTIDSATMVNKGLEVMEAKWLFDISFDRIQVVVQPQSIIHSMVEFIDGAVMAQLGTPDMRLPIQYALYSPERKYLKGERLNFSALRHIDFEEPDLENFPALSLAYEAGGMGGSMPTVYNAANEKAVSMFLNHRIGYLEIPRIIRSLMNEHKLVDNPAFNDILEIEAEIHAKIEERWR